MVNASRSRRPWKLGRWGPTCTAGTAYTCDRGNAVRRSEGNRPRGAMAARTRTPSLPTATRIIVGTK
eukprot:2546802-Pyramimonas_sp.AAC.1